MKIRKPGYSIEDDSWFIPLTQGVIALVDADQVPILSQKNWHAHNIGARWYAIRNDRSTKRQRTVIMHREIKGNPDGMVVDHKKHRSVEFNIIDNRRSNLRVCTHAQNGMNRRHQSGGTNKFKGVCWHKASGKWRAAITFNGTQKHLGLFDCELEAARAYNIAAVKYHGEFASPNEVPRKSFIKIERQ